MSHKNLILSSLLFYRFLYCSLIWGQRIKQIDQDLAKHIEMGIEIPKQQVTAFSHVSDLCTHSPKDQFLLLPSISNFHKFGYPSINTPNDIVSPNHITYWQHSLYDPDAKENPNRYFISEHLPTSPRNRLMHFIFNAETFELHQHVKFLLRRDTSLPYGEDIDEVHDYQPIPKKKHKQSSQLISVSQHAVFEQMDADLESFLNQANKQWKIYEIFQEQIISEGGI